MGAIMNVSQCVLIVLLVISAVFSRYQVYSAFVPIQVGQSAVNDPCLRCICEGASRCNKLAGCSGNVCGPYSLSEPLWRDVGSPLIKEDDEKDDDVKAFQNCANDEVCSHTAMKQYFLQYKRDCNGDKVIDCVDYAWLHQLGPNGCNCGRNNKEIECKPLSFYFAQDFYLCLHGDASFQKD